MLRCGAAPMPHHGAAWSHNAGPGNGERVRTPLKSMCRALRVPLMSRAGRADVDVQVHATRIICLPPSGRLCRQCSPSPATACRVSLLVKPHLAPLCPVMYGQTAAIVLKTVKMG